MPRYFYTAKDKIGQTKTDFLDAKNSEELASSLRQQGLFLISFQSEKSSQERTAGALTIFNKVSLPEKLFFIRNLQVMITAGVSLPKAVQTLSLQAKSKYFKKALGEIKDKIIQGKSFSESLVGYPAVFSELFQNMIKVGEESGTLEQVLKNLARQLEKEQELRSKIKGAMIYPLVIVSAMVLIGIAMLIFVVPQLAETFAELELSLPLTTRIVIFLGTFLREKWYWLPIIVFVVIFGVKQIVNTKLGKRVFDSMVLRIPIACSLIKQMNSANFARTLSSLTEAGVPLVRSLEIIAGTMNNVYFKESLLLAVDQVRKGAKLSEILRTNEKLYLPIVIQMIEVGEETGETARVLGELAGFLEEEVANAAKNISSLIEPLLMLLVGAAVGFFAVSMLQPMYSMLQGIGND